MINNTSIYNNTWGTYLDTIAANVKYYGNNYIFGNTYDINGSPTQGITSEVNGLRTDGTLSTGTALSRNYLTNPFDANASYGADRNTPFTGLQHTFTNMTSRAGKLPIAYAFGGREHTQAQPVRYDANTTLTGYGISSAPIGTPDRTPANFIASDITPISGSLTIDEGNDTYTSGINLTFTATTTGEWRIFGDVMAEITGTINAGQIIHTGITLSGDYGIKTILVQFSSGTNRATHYAANIDYVLTDCASRRNNKKFIDDSFRSHSDITQGNIVCALYGYPEDPITAYTKNRSGYNSGTCFNSGFAIEYISGYNDIGSFPYSSLSGNMIYILAS